MCWFPSSFAYVYPHRSIDVCFATLSTTFVEENEAVLDICKNVAGLQDDSEEKRDNKMGGMMLPEVQTMNNTTTAPPGSRGLPDDGGAGSIEDFPSELCRLQEAGGNVNSGSKRQLRDLIEDGGSGRIPYMPAYAAYTITQAKERVKKLVDQHYQVPMITLQSLKRFR